MLWSFFSFAARNPDLSRAWFFAAGSSRGTPTRRSAADEVSADISTVNRVARDILGKLQTYVALPPHCEKPGRATRGSVKRVDASSWPSTSADEPKWRAEVVAPISALRRPQDSVCGGIQPASGWLVMDERPFLRSAVPYPSNNFTLAVVWDVLRGEGAGHSSLRFTASFHHGIGDRERKKTV